MSPELVIVLTAVLVAVPCALVGSFLVLRRMSMLGDAISHAVLPGIAIGFFLAGGPALLPVLAGASLAGLVTVTLVELLFASRRIRGDAAIGVVFPALFAFGVYLVSRYGSRVHLDTQHVLYGEIAYVPWDLLVVGGTVLGPKSLWVLGVVTLLDLGFVLLCYKELKLATFDPDLAGALGFSPRVVHYALMAAVSATTVAAFDAVGAVLVVAMLIVPPATAYLLADRLPLVLGLAVGCGSLSAVVGYGLARALDASIAGAMATVAGLLFGLAVLGAPRHGVLASAVRRARQRRSFAGDLLLVHLARHGAAPAIPDALAARLRWTPRFTRTVVRQVVGAGLARPAVGSGAGGPALVLTERGRGRAAELAVA